MKKRGFGHLELVLGFVLFIFVIGFGIFFLGSENNSRGIERSLDYIDIEIEKNLRAEVESNTIKINNPGKVVAVKLSEPIFVGFGVEDDKGNVVSASEIAGTLYVDPAGSNLLTLRKSEDIINPEENLVNPDVDEDLYELGVSVNSILLSEKKLLELNESYNKDYNRVLSEFNLGRRTDFGFTVSFDSGDRIIADRLTDGNIEVFSQSKRVEILRADGSVEFSDFTIKVW